MKRYILILLSALSTVAFLTSCSHEKAPLMKMAVFPGDYPDPSIVRDGRDFYMTHTSTMSYPGLLVWHSTDLVNWEPISRAVRSADYSIWAPEICKVGGKFHIYYPTSDREVYVVVADTPYGPWSEPVNVGATGIDPGYVLSEDGNQYLYTNKGYAVRLSDDGLSATGDRMELYDGWDYPSDWETEGKHLESPKLFKRGEYFYLISAEGGTAGPATSHMVTVARSRSALGPWENMPDNPLVHTYSAGEPWWSKGHGTIFDDADGNWYIVYHAYRNSFQTLGRSSIIESINWTEDGWPMLADPEGGYAEVAPGSAQYDALRDFSNPLMWAKWVSPFEGGDLWTVIAPDRSYEVSAEFDLADGATAGLYLFYNENAFLGIKDSSGHFFLRIRNEGNVATTEKSLDGSSWTVVDSNVDVSGFQHNNYKGFLALRPAILVTGGATVRDFSYTPIDQVTCRP